MWTSLGTDEEFTPPAHVNNRDPRTIVRGWAWGSSNIIAPPREQLEALHDLIQGLLAVLPNVPDEFPGLTLTLELLIDRLVFWPCDPPLVPRPPSKGALTTLVRRKYCPRTVQGGQR